ncbi:hypothetical protein [Streptomyces sp. NPDC050422]|uniref:hypothetical protein n=1 Tax=Streptomyces sp. NPDC050422 TaxID=3365614 RepID=UPI0037926DAF
MAHAPGRQRGRPEPTALASGVSGDTDPGTRLRTVAVTHMGGANDGLPALADTFRPARG